MDDRSSIPGGGNEGIYILLATASRSALKSHPASYPGGTGGLYPEGEADRSPPSSAEVKNAWSYTSTPLVSFHGVVRN